MSADRLRSAFIILLVLFPCMFVLSMLHKLTVIRCALAIILLRKWIVNDYNPLQLIQLSILEKFMFTGTKHLEHEWNGYIVHDTVAWWFISVLRLLFSCEMDGEQRHLTRIQYNWNAALHTCNLQQSIINCGMNAEVVKWPCLFAIHQRLLRSLYKV